MERVFHAPEDLAADILKKYADEIDGRPDVLSRIGYYFRECDVADDPGDSTEGEISSEPPRAPAVIRAERAAFANEAHEASEQLRASLLRAGWPVGPAG